MTTSQTTAADICAVRSCGRSGCSCQRAVRTGRGVTHCPAHDDDHPSLSVGTQNDKPVFKCQAGCDQRSVFDALRALGLFEAVHLNGHVNGVSPVELRWRYVAGDGSEHTHIRIERPGESKRMWWEPRGSSMEALPLYQPVPLDSRLDDVVLVCEGEKKTDAAVRAGLLAVSIPGGASQRRYGSALEVLRGRDVVLLPDNDLPGRDCMAHLAGLLRTVARSVRTLALPGLAAKGDIADWLAMGHTAAEVATLLTAAPVAQVPDPLAALGIVSADTLMATEFPPQRHIVEGLLAEGAMLLSGKPKLGKGWMSLGLAVAVASGGRALGQLAVQQGDVLYLALEDGDRRVQGRLGAVLGAGGRVPKALYLAFAWKRLGDGCIEDLELWLDAHPDCRLVIVDTLKRVRAAEDNRKRLYDLDYDSLAPFADLGKRRHCCILVVHHNNKLRDVEDLTDMISGSTGMTGSVDGALVVHGVRNSGVLQMGLSHRDMAGDDWGLRFRTEGVTGWEIVGNAADVSRSEQRQAIVDLFRAEDGGPLTGKEVARLLGKDIAAVEQTLTRMARSGELLSGGQGSRGGYRLPEQRKTVSEVSEVIEAAEVSEVSEVAHIDEAAEGREQGDLQLPTLPTPISRTSVGGDRDSIISGGFNSESLTLKSSDLPELRLGPLCPAGCGVRLRGDFCPLCGQWYRESGGEP